MYIKQEGMMQMTFTKLPEIYYRRRTPLNAAAARKVDYPRSTPSRIGAVCRSQQGGKELADLVAVFADRAG